MLTLLPHASVDIHTYIHTYIHMSTYYIHIYMYRYAYIYIHTYNTYIHILHIFKCMYVALTLLLHASGGRSVSLSCRPWKMQWFLRTPQCITQQVCVHACVHPCVHVCFCERERESMRWCLECLSA